MEGEEYESEELNRGTNKVKYYQDNIPLIRI